MTKSFDLQVNRYGQVPYIRIRDGLMTMGNMRIGQMQEMLNKYNLTRDVPADLKTIVNTKFTLDDGTEVLVKVLGESGVHTK